MSGDNIAIRVKHVKKTYRQYKTNMQKIRFLLLMRDAGTKDEVLKDVSFDIKKGEKVCILGYQQSGKTTLMRILARVIRPDSGKARIYGEIAPILDVRLGFDGAMTGKDNYIRMSSALGRSEKDIKELEDSVFAFARLSKVKNEPIKTYQKGAATRLGFSIATAKKSDVVLFDSGLAFGTKAWNDACMERLKELISGDTTFVMTASKAKAAAQLCERGIVLHEGRVVFDGALEDAASYFRKNCRQHKTKLDDDVPEEPATEQPAQADTDDEGVEF